MPLSFVKIANAATDTDGLILRGGGSVSPPYPTHSAAGEHPVSMAVSVKSQIAGGLRLVCELIGFFQQPVSAIETEVLII